LRVVFDTNIYVSAFVLPGSRADAAMLGAMDGDDQLLLSKAILDELLGVMARKFSKNAGELARIAVFLSEISKIDAEGEKLSVLKDEPDNRILECAIAGQADAIVTGNKAMPELQEFKGIRILSSKEYLESE